MTLSDINLCFPDSCKNGMGLDPDQLLRIINVLNERENSRVLEFGSGGSTDVLLQASSEIGNKFSLLSFDHCEIYAFKDFYHKQDFKLRIRPLIQYDDKTWQDIFKGRYIYDVYGKEVPTSEYNDFKIQNTFYKLEKEDLKGIYDVVILDGPNGNGRSLAAAYLMEHVAPGTIIFVDDYHHYNFIEQMNKLLKFKVVDEVKKPDIHPLNGYCILEII